MKPGDSVGCRKLWQSVLLVAIQDALNPPQPATEYEAAAKHRNHLWMIRGPDMLEVAELAGFNGHKIRAAYIRGDLVYKTHGAGRQRKAA